MVKERNAKYLRWVRVCILLLERRDYVVLYTLHRSCNRVYLQCRLQAMLRVLIIESCQNDLGENRHRGECALL